MPSGIWRAIGPLLLGVIRMIWTTATYVIMPALVVEQQGFFAALKRSKMLQVLQLRGHLHK